MMLKDKVAVIYGAGGAIGGAVARAFASEGAKLFVTGRLRAPVDAVAREIVFAGGSAEAATIDALDEQAIARHLQYVIDRAYFLTARLAARHMIPNKSGVIMTVTALPSRKGTTLN